MPENEALQLLLGRSGMAYSDEDIAQAKEIVRELGYFPLALDQAASYINSRKLPLANFIPTYSKRRAEILAHTPKLWEYEKGNPKSSGTATNAFTTWELSLALLLEEPEGHSIAHLLALAAFFDNQSLHSDIFKAFANLRCSSASWVSCMCTDGAMDEYTFQDIVANLLSLSLIQGMDISSGGISLFFTRWSETGFNFVSTKKTTSNMPMKLWMFWASPWSQLISPRHDGRSRTHLGTRGRLH